MEIDLVSVGKWFVRDIRNREYSNVEVPQELLTILWKSISKNAKKEIVSRIWGASRLHRPASITVEVKHPLMELTKVLTMSNAYERDAFLHGRCVD